MIGKTTLHNLIRDEVYLTLWGGGLGVSREPTELLPKDLARRPADILTVPTPMCRQSAWQHFNRIAIHFAVVSPFHLGTGSQSSTEQHAQHNHKDRSILTHYNEQGIDFDSVVFDYVGGNLPGVDFLLWRWSVLLFLLSRYLPQGWSCRNLQPLLRPMRLRSDNMRTQGYSARLRT